MESVVVVEDADQRMYNLTVDTAHTFFVGDGVNQWKRALSYFHGRCAVCERPLNDLLGTHTDAANHWVAVNKGGDSNATNIVPLCHGLNGCNNKKQDLDPQTFLIKEFGKRKAKQILARIEAYFESVRPQANDPTALL